MKRSLLFVFLFLSLVISLPAQAKILELYVQPQVGGMGGIYSQKKLPWGDTERALNDKEDYFVLHRGGFYGVSMGGEFMFLRGQLDFNQSFKQGGVSSTFIALTVGLDADFEVDKDQLWTLFVMGGVALGTVNDSWLQKEEPQIAHEDLDAQIALVRVGARYEYKFTQLIRLSFEGGIGGHMLQLAQKAANDENSQSSGVHVYGQVGLRFVWDVFGGKKSQDDEGDGE